jgi:hypothetical protein
MVRPCICFINKFIFQNRHANIGNETISIQPRMSVGKRNPIIQDDPGRVSGNRKQCAGTRCPGPETKR